MAKLFGFEIKKSPRQEALQNKRVSVIPPVEDAVPIISPGAFFSNYSDAAYTQTTEFDLIQRYRIMEADPIVNEVITNITNEAIVYDDGNQPVYIDISALSDLSDFIKSKIVNEFENVLDLLDFKTHGHAIFRRWYVDGRIVYAKVIDPENPGLGMLELRRIEPFNVRRVRKITAEQDPLSHFTLYHGDAEVEYIYSPQGFLTQKTDNNYSFQSAQSNLPSNQNQGIVLKEDTLQFTSSGLVDTSKNIIIGHLNSAIKPFNQTNMMEDSTVIYYLTRSVDRRVFNVDVGKMNAPDAEQFMARQIDRYRTKLSYNVETGELNSKNNYMAIQEDYWLPKRADSSGWTIDNLEGGKQLPDAMEGTRYFKDKLYRALGYPASRLGDEQGFQIGKNDSITRDEVAFSKLIGQLRNQFSQLFYDLLRTQLIMKQVITTDDWDELKKKIRFVYRKDVFFAELKQAEILSSRLDLLSKIDAAVKEGYYAKIWVRKNVLMQSEEEIQEMTEMQWKEDNLAEAEEQPDEDFGSDNSELGNESFESPDFGMENDESFGSPPEEQNTEPEAEAEEQQAEVEPIQSLPNE